MLSQNKWQFYFQKHFTPLLSFFPNKRGSKGILLQQNYQFLALKTNYYSQLFQNYIFPQKNIVFILINTSQNLIIALLHSNPSKKSLSTPD
jgi:Mlc titration factor MtfA (ptsG expression regulator)